MHEVQRKIAVSKYRARPAHFVLTFGEEVARRTTYTTRTVGWETLYWYTVHPDRTAAHERCNATNRDTSGIRLVIPV